jgi:UDP:flavonoid glycosyltransferase YjiC (YdhE family)
MATVAALLARLRGPPLVFTPGTAMAHGRAFFAAAIEAGQRLERPVLLLTRYPEQLPARLPAGIVHRTYIPLGQLLPWAAALIHHGGIGTTAQALAAGIPQLVMPMSHDQPDNAARIERLGVGLRLAPGAFNGRRVAGALRRLLTEPIVARRCRTIAARCDGDRALAETCQLIEALASDKPGP